MSEGSGGGGDEDVWRAEYVSSEAYITEGLSPEGMAEVDRIVRGLLDLAELRMEAGHDYDEQNPMRLRTLSTDRPILWYQKFEHRKRICLVRVTWFD
ncbi:MAG TPA: hypothetical protein VFH94_28580 [Streptomyces sp.]|nr:hypothetical protein [Streptomyces sp.]